MARAKATWKTQEVCKMYEFQINNYEEARVLMLGKVFRTFKGQNARVDAKRFWQNIKLING